MTSSIKLCWVVLLLVLTVFSLTSLAMGPSDLSLNHIMAIIASHAGFQVDTVWKNWESVVFIDIRIPRVLLAGMVGGSLALCGAVLQGLFRNPLADPGIMGVTSGASLGAVLSMFFGLAAVSIWLLPIFAFIGAAATTFVAYTLSARQGQISLGLLLLTGLALGALNTALTSLLISLSVANFEIASQIVFWLMGGLSGRTWDQVWIMAPVFLITLPVLFFYSRELDALLVGEVHAAAIGIPVARVRKVLILTTALVTGAAVATAGAIGFIGLVVPHLLRLIAGPHHRNLLPLSILCGAALLIAADWAARILAPPTEIPLGVVTASLGTPFFIFLLVRRKQEVHL